MNLKNGATMQYLKANRLRLSIQLFIVCIGIIIFIVAIKPGARRALAKAWQEYSTLSSDIADGDEFRINDVSDTADHSSGTNKNTTWGKMREQLRTDRPVCLSWTEAETGDDFLCYKNTTGEVINIQNIYGVLQSGTEIRGGFDECDSDGANCVAVDSDIIFDDNLENTDDGTLSNPHIDNLDYIRWHTTSVSSPGWLIVCFTFK